MPPKKYTLNPTKEIKLIINNDVKRHDNIYNLKNIIFIPFIFN